MNWTPWHQIWGIAHIEGRPPNPEVLALLHAHLPPNLVFGAIRDWGGSIDPELAKNEHRDKNLQMPKL